MLIAELANHRVRRDQRSGHGNSGQRGREWFRVHGRDQTKTRTRLPRSRPAWRGLNPTGTVSSVNARLIALR